MRILVFTEGTVLMHGSGAGCSREERVRQVREHEASVHDFSTYVPIGRAAGKLGRWHGQGATLLYLTSRTAADDIQLVERALSSHRFPSGRLFHRLKGEEYAEVAKRVRPDILIEDDCESIGGSEQMASHGLGKRSAIRVIAVKEFSGIDGLPDSLRELEQLSAQP